MHGIYQRHTQLGAAGQAPGQAPTGFTNADYEAHPCSGALSDVARIDLFERRLMGNPPRLRHQLAERCSRAGKLPGYLVNLHYAGERVILSEIADWSLGTSSHGGTHIFSVLCKAMSRTSNYCSPP